MIGDWTEPQETRLKSLWASGLSASQIAAELPGRFSRSAILGKIMRLKLPPRDKGHPTSRPRQYSNGSLTAQQSAPRPRHNATRLQAKANGHHEAPQRRNQTNSLAEKIAIAEAEPGLPPRFHGEKPDGTGIKIADLNSINCHWPKGDPLEDDFEFCGAKAISGMPYCAHHCRMSYGPSQDRRSQRPLF